MHQRGLLWTAIVVSVLCLVVWPFSAPADSYVQYQFNILHAFGAANDGNGPDSPVIFDQKGNLYGVTYGGGTSVYGGVAFELSPGSNGEWTETILYNFPGAPGDGYTPVGMTIDGSGNLYGTTQYGGVGAHCDDDNGCGTVFELSAGTSGQWTETILYNFCSLPNCADGGLPGAAPTLGPGGVLYGTAGDTAFELTPGTNGWTYTTLYKFCSLPNCADGYAPIGSLTLDGRGNLYGETELGTDNGGTAFTLRPQPDGQWKETVLHTFGGNKYGGTDPSGDVTLHGKALYGTTQGGGGQGCLGVGCGTIYKLARNPSGTGVDERVLHAFGANGAQGITPIRAVVFDKRGDLFGITDEGGSPICGCGVVYGMKPQGNGQWVYQVLHTFVGTDGVTPNSTLTLDSAGNLYGTTAGGGPNGGGTAFELSPTAQASK